MQATGSSGFLDPADIAIEGRVFRDDDHQAELEERGYVVLPFLEPDEVAALVDGYDRLARELGGSSAPGDYNDTFAEFSIIHSRPEFRRRSFDLITSVLGPVADRHLVDHRPLIANFVNKPAGTGVVPTHQNFSVVDEARFRSVSVWVALVDCVVDNGAMSMLDGSHRALRGRRGMWAYQAFGGIGQDELDPLLRSVEVPAGHAVILDDALVHYSPPNRTDERRLAIQFVMVPADADPMWFQQVGEAGDALDIAVWQIEPRFFFEFWHGDGDTRYATDGGRLTLPRDTLDLDGLLELLGEPATASGPPDDPPPAAAAAPRQRGLRALISRLSR